MMFSTSVFSTALLAAAPDESKVVEQIVSDNVARLLEKYNVERKYYATDPNRFLTSMDAALSEIVDFRRIAARVMGKYGRMATSEQKDRFVEIFKKSLYGAYTRTLVESGVYKINVKSAEINTRSDDRATVNLDVLTENGTVYPVVYSMHKTDTGAWLLENVIVFGVNIGLAFRDRFETQYSKNKGDLDAVINTWTVDLKLKKDKEA